MEKGEKLEQEKNQNLDPHRNLHLYHGEEEEEEEEEEQERVSLRNPSTASFQELFNQNQLLYARRLGQPPEKQRSYFPSSPSPLGPAGAFGESAPPREKTRENPPSRLGRRSSAAAGGGGEIVEVQGGHIVRATGRKDRHSKVCTAKGPRDRRVRLAAHTAIQFYDVQDRLGYDRPSKAVDWLIKKAKAAIDELAELPAWHPTASAPENAQKKKENDEQSGVHHAMLGGGQNEQMSSFLPPSLDSDAIADTIKSFFPTGSAGEASSSAIEFHNFSATGHNNSEDLRLSLQSFQDPIMLHHHRHHYTPPPNTNPNHPHHSEQARAPLLSGTPLGFDGWPPPPPWNSGGDPIAAGGSFQFNSPPPQLFGSGQFFTSQQRGPLQSSNTPSLRAWMDPSAAITISMADHGQHHHQHPGYLPVYPSSAFTSGYGYSGFHIPARIQGDEEEHDGYSDKPSSASSDSRH